MSWALHLAVLLSLAACITAPSDPTDQRLRGEKDAPYHDACLLYTSDAADE